MIACDVSNPFFGEEGAAYVYAPQKGANSLQVIGIFDASYVIIITYG